MRQILLSILVMSIFLPGNGTNSSVRKNAEISLLALPDLNAAYIARLPRYDYTATKNQPAPGDSVTFQAVVANRGGQNTGTFAYEWYIDSLQVMNSTYPNLLPGESITLSLGWTWQNGPHTVRIELDPVNLIAEVSEQNNAVEDRTNALAVGFWVEQSVYDWFNVHQVELGLGSVSWDDWAQRQLKYWNQMFETAISPLTPQGIVDRVRLDKIVIIPDGSYQNCANGPTPEDRTVDLVWGFTSEYVGVHSNRTDCPFNFYLDNPDFQVFEPPLLHEMSHARYLVDLYGLGIYVNHVYLSDSVNSTSSIINVTRNVENDDNFPIPAYLAIDGEMVICQSKDGSIFSDCLRGAEETTPRSHALNALVNLAIVRLQDGQGNLVQGSSSLPIIGYWEDSIYSTRYPNDLMGMGLIYEEHSAYAWNRIAGQRPVCGNYNAPCNIGEYLNDLPSNNVLEIHGIDGTPLYGARVEIYRAKPFPIWYGKVFLPPKDAMYFTNSQGRVNLGKSPFATNSSIIHTYGYSNATILIKISKNNESIYRFFDVTEANVAYWSGYHDTATYVIPTTLSQGPPPQNIFLPIIVDAFPPPPPLLEVNFENTFNGKNGELGHANGPSFVPGQDGLGALFDNSDTLYYDTNDNIDPVQGHIEFWLKPLWNGNDYQSFSFFEVGNTWFNRMRITKDGANNFRFMVWNSNTEYGVAHNVSDWKVNEWHYIKVSWQNDTIFLYINGVLCETKSAIDLPDYLGPRIYIGSTSSGDGQAQAVIDDFAIYAQP